MKFMLRILIVLYLLIFSLNLFAQNKYGAFGAPSIKYTSISNRGTLISGGKFGLVINKSIVLGGGFYGLLSGIKTNFIDVPSGQHIIMNMNYGGLDLEYILFPCSIMHVSLEILLAGGGLYFAVPDKSVPHNSYSKYDLLVYEPSLNIEFNASSWLHIDGNVSYRIITSYDYAAYGISKENLTGISVGLIFKLGSY
jgi:hypothetical protein